MADQLEEEKSMKVQINHVSPIQTAKVISVLYFIVSIPFIAIFALISLIMPGKSSGFSFFMILLPVLYLVLGFIFTAIAAWIYNLVASWVGGIEFTTIEKT